MVQRGQHGSHFREEAPPSGQQPHAARAALEQLHAQLFFQRTDVPRQRRLRDVQSLRRRPQRALLGHGHEVSELVQAHDEQSTTASAPLGLTKSVMDRVATAPEAATMTIPILSPSEVARMRRAGRAAAGTLAHVAERLTAGITTREIDRWVRDDTRRRDPRA